MKNVRLIILVIIVILVLLNWSAIKKFFLKSVSAYDDCVAKNKAMVDGSPCVNCIPVGSQAASFQGTIVSGVCQPTQVQVYPKIGAILNQSNKLQVINQAGAIAYAINTDKVLDATNLILDYGEKINSTQVITQPSTYYNIDLNTWLSASDVKII